MWRLNFGRQTFRTVAIAALGAILAGCNVTKHLDTDKGERLLTKNSLHFDTQQKLGLSERTALTYETSGLFKQPPNSKILWMRPRVSAYYRLSKKDDKVSQWLVGKFAEEPAIYNEAKAVSTARNLENFMRLRGYFNASCSFTTKFVGDTKAEVNYELTFGPLYKINSVVYQCRDSTVDEILQALKPDALIKPGAAVDGRQFEAEKLRITNELRNLGYAQFVPGYIEFNGDSTKTRVDVEVDVLTPTDSTNHERFIIGTVSVFSSLVPEINTIRNDATLNGISYFSNQNKFLIKPRHLDKIIRTRPGNLYQLSDLEQTNKNLSTIGAFRFVSVRPQPDSIRPDTMNINISYAPMDRFTYGANWDVNYSDNSAVPGLLGLAASLTTKHRNLFSGGELLSVNLRYNVEFDINNRVNPIFSQGIKFQNDLRVPRFFDYFGLWKGLNHVGFGKYRAVSHHLLARLRQDARAHFGLSYNYEEQLNFYKLNLFNASFGYEFSPDLWHTYTFNHIGIDVLRQQSQPRFDSLCEVNPLVCLNFEDQLFTGFILRSLGYSASTKTNRAGERYFFRLGTDFSGLEISLLNRLIDKNKIWTIDGLKFARFFRFETSGGYSRNFTKNIAAGISVSSGVIVPFDQSEQAPFVKQFSVGGASGLRAWRVRQLGPGGYDSGIERSYFQASDFKFEFLSEVRFPIFWWFKGAVFFDGGNIWSLYGNDMRPDALLRWNSYKNIALGTGAGLRFDFGYSVIRVDLGMKLRQPFPDEAGSYWFSWKTHRFFREVCAVNLAVGYPF